MNTESRPGLIRRFFSGLWWLVDGSRRLLLNLIFIGLIAGLLWLWLAGGPKAMQDKTVLVLDLAGPLVEQRHGSARERAQQQISGDAGNQTVLRDVLRALELAAKDAGVSSVLLLTDDFGGAGLPTLREVAAAIERTRAAGKTVVAFGENFDQRSYYLAAHASEVYLHPMGTLAIQGYGRLRTYYADAFERLGVRANVIRTGAFKNAFETFSANEPSKETLESDALIYDALWAGWTQGVERARKLPAGSIAQGIEQLPERLAAVDGNPAQLALQGKLVDKLMTRDTLRALLIERGARDEENKSFRQIGLGAYLALNRPKTGGDVIGVVVAEGPISDGDAPPGQVGGDSTAKLLRQAREDDKVKAVVLRVDSPGGSAFASELVRRELELTRSAGKPVVVSMGDVAASGGYWISMAADEVIADPMTITGSIGVIAMLPTGEGLMDKLSLRSGGYSTTWLANAYDPRKALDPRFEEVVRSVIGHIYKDFVGQAAAARKTTPEKLEAVAGGRVWTGTQALERGLIDRTGSFGDALKSAATRAKIEGEPTLRYIERSPGRLAGLIERFGDAALPGGLAAALGLDMAPLPAAAAAVAFKRDLAWLAQVAERRQPYAAYAHCLCEPAW